MRVAAVVHYYTLPDTPYAMWVRGDLPEPLAFEIDTELWEPWDE
ncbi:hypothetical protein [Actinomadura macra]|nr:hypothetical protein [Actinomadura macra]